MPSRGALIKWPGDTFLQWNFHGDISNIKCIYNSLSKKVGFKYQWGTIYFPRTTFLGSSLYFLENVLLQNFITTICSSELLTMALQTGTYLVSLSRTFYKLSFGISYHLVYL